jgi:hypothetical protein
MFEEKRKKDRKTKSKKERIKETKHEQKNNLPG